MKPLALYGADAILPVHLNDPLKRLFNSSRSIVLVGRFLGPPMAGTMRGPIF